MDKVYEVECHDTSNCGSSGNFTWIDSYRNKFDKKEYKCICTKCGRITYYSRIIKTAPVCMACQHKAYSQKSVMRKNNQLFEAGYLKAMDELLTLGVDEETSLKILRLIEEKGYEM